jgi:ATP-dependent helicase/nuclease subunit A
MEIALSKMTTDTTAVAASVSAVPGCLPPAPDQAARERALDVSRSFIVQAPAGSGKTELLIRRYLALLATVESPEEIVAITFTRKAAAEMRVRVLRALAARLAEAEEPRARAIVENPQRLRIQTIDSLCASLTRQMPMLSRFGAQPESTADPSAMYLEAARATLALIESGQAQHAAAVARLECLLAHLDNDAGRVEHLLAGMLARRDHWLRHVSDTRVVSRAQLEAALERLREAARAEAVRSYPPGKAWSADEWAATAIRTLTKEGTWRKLKNAEADALKAAGGEPLRLALVGMSTLPPAQYSDMQWAVLESILGLLPLAVAELKLVFQSHGQVDFTEVSQGALRALGEEGEPTDLALALDYRIRHLLVDEFQDTSISQYELLARLTEGWMPGDGRTLFVVGDPMQSIYRFREAEVGKFLAARAQGIGTVALEPVSLTANFRSQAGIVDWVNDTFARLMPEREDAAAGAVPYTASVPVRAALPDAAVGVHAFFDKDVEGEAARVVDLVRAAQQDNAPASVAILVRNRTALPQVVAQLQAAGLRFRAIEIERLDERPVVQDLLALTRSIAHAGDRLAWLAVLRAPWCGLTLAGLSALCEDDERLPWDLLNDPERVARLAQAAPGDEARLARVREALAAAMALRGRAPLRELVGGTWLALGGPACVQDPTDLEDAEIYLDHLEAHAHAGGFDGLAAFEESLQKLYALPDLQAPDTLQVMTIHKAKGLEFDHVIVPGLGRAPRNDGKRLMLWLERALPGAQRNELLLAPIEATGAGDDAIYAWVRQLEAERERLESTRLLYVAATRARQRLHLLGVVRLKEGAPQLPPRNTLLARLWPVLEPEFVQQAALHLAAASALEAEQAQVQDVDAAAGDTVVDEAGALLRLPADWRLPGPPPAVAWQAPGESGGVREALEFSWAGETARHVGTVTHRWLQAIAAQGLSAWDRARLEGLRARVPAQLGALGVPAGEREAATGRVVQALANALDDERGRWVLGEHAQAASELRLRMVAGDRVQLLVVDRTFVDDGTRWVIDYKTGGHEGADVEGFLDRECERYRPQLERYAKALAGAGGQRPRLGLYFPMLKAWREL